MKRCPSLALSTAHAKPPTNTRVAEPRLSPMAAVRRVGLCTREDSDAVHFSIL